MRWLSALLALLVAFGAVRQLPYLDKTVNAVLFVILTVQFVAYTATTVLLWKDGD